MAQPSTPRSNDPAAAQPAYLVRWSALLLLAQALLVTSPLVTLDGLWTGPRALGAALRRSDLTSVLTTTLPLALAVIAVSYVAAAAGVCRGGRRAALAGIALSLLSLVVVALPRPRGLTTGAAILHGVPLALVAVATLALLAIGLRHASPGRSGSRVPHLIALTVAVLLAIGVPVGAVSTSVPTGLMGALLLDDASIETLTSSGPLQTTPVAQNPHLGPNATSNIHGDGAMTDSYTDRRVLDPRDARVRSAHLGGVCASVLFDSHGRLVAVCVNPTEVYLNVLDPRTLEVLARRQVADRPFRTDFATNFSGGGYAVLDDRDRVVLPTSDGRITRWSVADEDGKPEIGKVDEFDVSDHLDEDEPITSAVPDASGLLWFVGREGTLGLLDFDTGTSTSTRFEDEGIENSIAVGKDGGAYVVTSAAMYFVEVRDNSPAVSWREAYDVGSRKKPGQSSRASGTTPTLLLGERYVAITDNADPRMHVVVYDTAPEVSGSRVVCSVPVFRNGHSATENSLIAVGSSLFVENNYGYDLLGSAGGRSSEPGLARIDVDPASGSCNEVWTNNEIRIPSVVSKATAPDGVVVTYTKPTSAAGVDGFYFTAVDAGTGEEMWRRLAGTGALANNHYAAIYVGPDGSLYVGSVGGLFALTSG